MKETETIIFNNATGIYSIDFTENGRMEKFKNGFSIKICNVENNTEKKIQGVEVVKSFFGRLVTSVTLDGIFNNGYITLKSKKN